VLSCEDQEQTSRSVHVWSMEHWPSGCKLWARPCSRSHGAAQCVRTHAQDSRRAYGLLYPAAVRYDRKRLIRRLCHARPPPVRSGDDLLKYCSLVRSRRQCRALPGGQKAPRQSRLLGCCDRPGLGVVEASSAQICESRRHEGVCWDRAVSDPVLARLGGQRLMGLKPRRDNLDAPDLALDDGALRAIYR
jgi:hypothetical protein